MTATAPLRLDATTRAAITSGRLAHLVTINPDGSPQVSCIYVGWDGDELVAGHLRGLPQAEERAGRNPRVSVSIESDVEFAGFSPYIVVEGTATVEEGGAVDTLRRISTEQLGPDHIFHPEGRLAGRLRAENPPDPLLRRGPVGRRRRARRTERATLRDGNSRR